VEAELVELLRVLVDSVVEVTVQYFNREFLLKMELLIRGVELVVERMARLVVQA
jgi:hypothetical protein